jgi:hypothetical protein
LYGGLEKSNFNMWFLVWGFEAHLVTKTFPGRKIFLEASSGLGRIPNKGLPDMAKTHLSS